jgi:phosphomannomutase
MDIHEMTGHSWLGLTQVAIEEAQISDDQLIQLLKSLSVIPADSAGEWRSQELPDDCNPELFGTSGIRGIFDPDISGHPVKQFVSENRLTPIFAYFFGRATGCILKSLRSDEPVWVVMDPRHSSLMLAMAVMRGLKDEGLNVTFGGVAVTPCYTQNRGGMTVVVTASHNPIQYNGLKVFWQGRPLVSKLEVQLEQYLSVFSDLYQEGSIPKSAEQPGELRIDVLEFERRQFSVYQNTLEIARLRLDHSAKLESCFLPLDLAYGSAACPVDDNGRISRLSAPLAALMSLGIPVIGYGCMRNPSRMNLRIGAAYAYGETPDNPMAGEIAKFARGLPGYGGSSPRLAFVPQRFTTSNQNLTDLLDEITPSPSVLKMPVGFPGFNAEILILYLDHPEAPKNLVTEFEADIMRRHPLPGLMVDGDADRILVTAPNLSKQGTPYLTGDAMLRVFIELNLEHSFDEVVFTVESGIALEKALEHRRNALRLAGHGEFDMRIVTVGDRAIIDYFLDRGKGSMMGGEPSGHIIFGERSDSDLKIVDDPFITYFRLLDGLGAERFDLDRTLSRMMGEIPDAYCARKPDARTANGISLAEKSALELWDSRHSQTLSDYAEKFIPAYMEMYGMGYSKAFFDGSKPAISLSWEWERLLLNKLSTDDWDGDLPVAMMTFGAGTIMDELAVGLHIDRRRWAGSDVIRLSFSTNDLKGRTVKMGEGVFRNSGTSPKNAGYHKLWPVHPRLNITLSDGKLREILDAIANERANWTEKYIVSVLRRSC